jgi:hypothetical protein
MIGNAGGVGGQLGLGAISRSVSIGAGYLVGGAALGLMLPLVWRLRRRGGIEDVIVGGEAGVGSACAAQGLPEITGVDSKILAPAADV